MLIILFIFTAEFKEDLEIKSRLISRFFGYQ